MRYRLENLRRACVRASTVTVVLLVAGVFAATQSFAQNDFRIEAAEVAFDAAVVAFEAGSYEEAYQGFRKVVDSYDLNRRSSAARLMAGKSLYRMGEYDRAIDALERLLRAFPGTRYAGTARTTLEFAEQARAHIEEMSKVRQIGVLLPTTADDISLTQSLFNGFRIAIDEHNATEGANPVRMVFAPSTGSMDQAFQDFADAGVSAVFGPLYSEEAVEAGELAEARGIVMLTPLATDEDVSEGRRFVFQANPTLTMRGRLMARFATQSLSMTDVGIVGEYGNSLSERMAEGFQEEIEELGAELRFVKMLNGTSGWFSLADKFKSDSLAGLDAIYLPITGGQASTLIKAALDNLDRLELPIKLLGNKEWDRLPSRTQPSKYTATYTNDYYVSAGDSLVIDFAAKYQVLAEEKPGQLAYVGFDVGRYLARLVSTNGGVPLADRMRAEPVFKGLAVKLDFSRGNVNQAMFYQRYRNGQIELLR